jgi:hypothetical protein
VNKAKRKGRGVDAPAHLVRNPAVAIPKWRGMLIVLLCATGKHRRYKSSGICAVSCDTLLRL